jgi:hypothetical protein
MKKDETRDETLERLARDARKGAGAAKRFETLVKRVAKTPTPAARAKESSESNDVATD